MSLINQMLQDLEKRRPDEETPILSSAQVMAVPKRRRNPLFWPVLLLLVPAAGVLAWLLLRAPAPPKVSEPLAAAAVPAPPQAAETAAEQPPLPIPADALLGEPVLKVSTELMKLPQAPAPEPRKSEPAPTNQALPRSAANEGKPKPPTTAPKESAPPGQAAARQGVPPSMAAITKQVRETSPQQQTENEYRKALSLLQQGRVEEAIDGFAQVLRLDARHAAARQTMIGLLVEAKRYGEAERRLQEGLNLDANQPELAMTLARLQVERGDVRSGLAVLERTLPYAAERPAYQAFLAALLQREDRHREAIEHYLLATRKAPQSGVWLMGLGISLQEENRLQEARQAFNRAKASNSLSPELEAFVEQRLKQLGQ